MSAIYFDCLPCMQQVPTAPAFIAPACAPTKYWTIFKVENQIIQVQVGIIGYQATT